MHTLVFQSECGVVFLLLHAGTESKYICNVHYEGSGLKQQRLGENELNMMNTLEGLV